MTAGPPRARRIPHRRWRRLATGLLPVAAVVGAAGVASWAASARHTTFRPATTVTVVDHTLDRHTWQPAYMWVWPSNGALSVTGRLRNEAAAPTGLLRVVVTFLDSGGVPVAEAIGFPPQWRVAPGQVTPFLVPWFPNDRIASYTLRVEEAGPPPSGRA